MLIGLALRRSLLTASVLGLLGTATVLPGNDRAARRDVGTKSAGQKYVVQFDGGIEAEDAGVQLAQGTQPTPADAKPVPLPDADATQPRLDAAPAASPPTAVPAAPRRPTPPRPSDNAELRQRLARTRMARSPEMFGDQFVAQNSFLTGGVDTLSGFEFGLLTAPTNINAFSQKISENNHPLPRDRVFYTFNAFEDALRIQSSYELGIQQRTSSSTLLRHTVGIEKTFFDGQTSLEVRMPFLAGNSISRATEFDTFGYDGGDFGNLMLTGKVLLYETEEYVLSSGMGLLTPTASDSRAKIDSSTITTQSDAVYLSPFVGALWMPSEEWFFTSFGQVQVGTNGDAVVVSNPLDGSARIGRLNAPAAMMLDFSVGRWLFRDRSDAIVTGMALVGEVHTFQALEDNDRIRLAGPNASGLTFGSVNNPDRLSLTTMTLGLHNQLRGNSTLRIAGVVPISSAQFDAEMIVQFNVFY